MSLLRGILLSAISLTFFFVLNNPALAQNAGGRVVGTVSDQQRGVIPGANVTVTDAATKLSTTGVTDKDGFFQVLDLPVGTYHVSVGGFQSFQSRGVLKSRRESYRQHVRTDHQYSAKFRTDSAAGSASDVLASE
jgi:hypothetical protein